METIIKKIEPQYHFYLCSSKQNQPAFKQTVIQFTNKTNEQQLSYFALEVPLFTKVLLR